MADGVNKCMFFGRLGDDAESKQVGNSTLVSFRLAVEESFKTGDTWNKKTEWIPCSMWGPRGKSVAQYLTKGKPLFVEGSFSTRTFDDKNGKKQYRSEIRVSNVCFVGGGGKSGGDEHHDDPNQDDIPF